jgi:hypothetical protein
MEKKSILLMAFCTVKNAFGGWRKPARRLREGIQAGWANIRGTQAAKRLPYWPGAGGPEALSEANGWFASELTG